jgi:hypothetical protein
MTGFAEKHLVIGAGFVGLGTAKALKQYGIPYDQVDADNDLGGNWYHGVYRNVHIISSKNTTQFTDYPMPGSYPDFPSAAQMLSYLKDYAGHFKLREHMEFNKAVQLAVPTGNEKWEVTFADGEKRIYKGILICNGHHWDKRFPEYPGTFSGELMHSKDYLNEEILEGKKVLVIGGGNSACDIAVDAARAAKEAHISMRSGYWFLPKSMIGIPTVEFIKPWLPVWAQRILLKCTLRIVVGRYEDYGLQKPDHNIFEKHPTINSLLLYYLKHGVIKPHPDIKRWEGKTVEFVDGKKEEFDLIIAATGFYVSFPFLPAGLVEIKNNIPQIPLGNLHAKYKGIYLVGWQQARYGVGPLITAGSPNLCELILTQDKMVRPAGMIAERMGMKAPDTHLVDPMKALKYYKRSRFQLKLMPLLEKLFFRNEKYVSPSVEEFNAPKISDKVKYY